MTCSKLFCWLISILCLVSACQSLGLPTTLISNSDAQRIDHLLKLIDQRLSIASQVANAKWNSGAAIDDAERESRILDGVDAQASAMKIDQCDLTLLREFFQDQFKAGKIIQINLFLSWRSMFRPKHEFDDAPNLPRGIRPKLDKLTPELISAFCDAQTILAQPGARHYLFVQADKLIRNDVDGAARRQALEAFRVQ